MKATKYTIIYFHINAKISFNFISGYKVGQHLLTKFSQIFYPAQVIY